MGMRYLLLLFAGMVLAGCLSTQTVSGQGSRPKPKIDKNQPPITDTGNYREIDVKDSKADDAYEFLKEQLAGSHPEITLISVTRAYSQVVAGFKIRLICSYRKAQKQENRLLALVYIDPGGNKRLHQLELGYAGE